MNNQEFWNKLERIINNIKASSNNIEVIKHEIDNINSLLNTYPGILDGEENRKELIIFLSAKTSQRIKKNKKYTSNIIICKIRRLW